MFTHNNVALTPINMQNQVRQLKQLPSLYRFIEEINEFRESEGKTPIDYPKYENVDESGSSEKYSSQKAQSGSISSYEVNNYFNFQNQNRRAFALGPNHKNTHTLHMSVCNVQRNLSGPANTNPSNLEELIDRQTCIGESSKLQLKKILPLEKSYNCKSLYYNFEEIVQAIKLREKYVNDLRDKAVRIDISNPCLQGIKEQSINEHLRWVLRFFSFLVDNDTNSLMERIKSNNQNELFSGVLRRSKYCAFALILFTLLDSEEKKIAKDVKIFCKKEYPDGLKTDRSRLKFIAGANSFVYKQNERGASSVLSSDSDQQDRINFIKQQADWYRTRAGTYIRAAQLDHNDINADKNSTDKFASDTLRKLLADEELKNLYPKNPKKESDRFTYVE